MRMKKHLAVCAGMVLFILYATTFASAEIKIGVNAPRGELQALKRFGELRLYLEHELGDTVTLIPKRIDVLLLALEKEKFDFVLANPVHTAIMQQEETTIPLATMNLQDGPEFAGVIIAKKGSGISSVQDLRGKKIMTLTPLAAAAYVFQAYYMLEQGIDPRKESAAFVQGKKLDDLVYSVKAGVMDAAFIKSGILELMDSEGLISMDEFVVLNERQDAEFHQRHTTPLYPSWFFSATTQVNPELREKLKRALLNLTPDHPACTQARIRGFIEPLPLDNLHNALKALQLRPYLQ